MNPQTVFLYRWMKANNMPVSHYANLPPYFRKLLKELIANQKPKLRIVH